MSEVNELQAALSEEDSALALTELKAKATLLGITFSPNIGLATLKAKVDAIDNPESADALTPQDTELESEANEDVATLYVNPKVEARNRATRLVRVAIVCQDENRKQLEGEYFTFRNSLVGKVTKFVPYNCEAAESYFVPACIVNMMRRKKAQFFTKRTINGVNVPTPVSKAAFIVTELPPLTDAEMDAIAKRQAARKSV